MPAPSPAGLQAQEAQAYGPCAIGPSGYTGLFQDEEMVWGQKTLLPTHYDPNPVLRILGNCVSGMELQVKIANYGLMNY